MKSLSKALALLSLTLFAATANAATVSITPSPAATVITGTVGDRVVIGFFRNFNAAAVRAGLISSDRDTVLNYIRDNFVPLGDANAPIFTANGVAQAGFGNPSTASVTLVSGVPVPTGGSTNVTLTSNPANSLTAGGLARGTRMFLLVYDAPTVDEATALGVFSATDANWTVGATVTNVSLPLTQLNDSATEAFRGAIGSLILAPLVPIPEPSVGLLSLFAALGLIARRRR